MDAATFTADDFDVSSLDTLTRSETGVEMPLVHPKTGQPMKTKSGKAISITLRGPLSDVSESLNRAFAKRRQEYEARGVPMSPDEFERERHELLCAVTVTWTFTQMDGKPFPPTPENIERFWADARWKWVQFDAWRFCQSEGNYLPL